MSSLKADGERNPFVFSRSTWAVGASVLTGSQALAQECGQHGRRHTWGRGTGTAQHRARGDGPQANSTALCFGASRSSRHFLGKSKEDEVGRLEMLWGEGIGGAGSRTL